MADGPRYVLWGSGGHAKVLASLIARHHGKVVALFDNNPQAVSILPDVPLYIGKQGFEHWRSGVSSPLVEYCGLAAIGGARGKDRIAIEDFMRSQRLRIEPLVHDQASVCSTAILGPGTQVLAQAVVAAGAVLGKTCIVNHRAVADHECLLGDGVHLAPGATLCGCVTIGSCTLIGAGAVVLPRLHIGDNVVVGAGAVVIRDVPSGVVVVGNPARIVSYL